MKKLTGSKKVSTRIVRSFLAPCVLFAAVTPSFGVVIGSFVVNGDNTVTYSYQVDNSAGSFDIAAWALEFAFAVPDWNQFDAPLGDVTVPNQDWIASPGTPVTGLSAQDFLSLSASGDVLINTDLTGFSFTSSFLPGLITYHEFSATGESATGETIGPSLPIPVVVPDSGGRMIGAMALASLAAVGASRKFNRRFSAR